MVTRAESPQFGFTLIELTIVMLIISLLLLVILKSTSLIENSQTKDLVAIAKDYRIALADFKERYKYVPGDYPDAQDELSTVSAGCRLAPNVLPTTGNGLIDTVIESGCVNEQLNLAELVSIPAGALLRDYKEERIIIRVIARSASNLAGTASFPASIRHIVEYSNLPLSMARGIDSALDDGNLITGNVQRSDTGTPLGDPVPFLGVKLN